MSETLTFYFDRLATPIGELVIVADGAGNLCVTSWTQPDFDFRRYLQRQYASAHLNVVPAANPRGLTEAIRSYFEGNLAIIDSLPVNTGGTPFQQLVWNELRTIPCGTTISYAELARRIGRPSAVRAVGLANGANPVGVVIPCHRVIGSDCSLTGYGGGVDRKLWLLRHERVSAFCSQAAHPALFT